MKRNPNGYKIKDFVLLGIITAIYFVLFMVIGFTTAGLNPLLHAFSPAVTAFIVGTIILFLMYKIPKFGVLSLFTLILFALITLIGMGYLPWFLTSIISAIIADIICVSSGYKSLIKNAIAGGLLSLGNVAGGIIPAMFFAEQYSKEWIARGMPEESMAATIACSTGWIGVTVLIVNFIGGFLGIIVASKILARHFK